MRRTSGKNETESCVFSLPGKMEKRHSSPPAVAPCLSLHCLERQTRLCSEQTRWPAAPTPPAKRQLLVVAHRRPASGPPAWLSPFLPGGQEHGLTPEQLSVGAKEGALPNCAWVPDIGLESCFNLLSLLTGVSIAPEVLEDMVPGNFRPDGVQCSV